MKKIFTFLSSCVLFTTLMAQSCGTHGSGVCTATGGPVNGGFDDLNGLPCIEKGVFYSNTLQFKMFSTFSFQGFQNVDSMEFVSIENLPCGICWAVNKPNKRYKKNEPGCIVFSGKTNDAAGQYKLDVSVNAWINGQPSAVSVNAFLFNQTGVKIVLRVKDNGSANCPNADTTSSANYVTAATGCTVGIDELNAHVSDLRIVPGTVTSSAVVSFIAEKDANYAVKITDMAGAVISTTPFEVKTGLNTTVIERGNMAAGLYLMSLTDGVNAITRRFTVAD